MSAGTVFRVFRHRDPATPDAIPAQAAAERLSFQHLDDDPSCTGAQVADTGAERVA